MTIEFQPIAKPERDALQREQASIERRRALEAQRKPVVFDVKKRTIGVGFLRKLVSFSVQYIWPDRC